MKVFQYGVLLIIILNSCTNIETENNNSHFDKQTGILEVEYEANSDNYIDPIIQYSKIRNEGYGILLIVENSISLKKRDEIIGEFRKHDINVVHVFNVNKDTLPNNTRVAIEGARFNWVFFEKEIPYPLCEHLKTAFNKSTENGGVIVVEMNQSEVMERCSNHKSN
jgi:hypothetical protein